MPAVLQTDSRSCIDSLADDGIIQATKYKESGSLDPDSQFSLNQDLCQDVNAQLIRRRFLVNLDLGLQ